MQGDDLAILLFLLTLAITFAVEAVKAETQARRVGFGVVAALFLMTALSWHQLERTWPRLGEWAAPVATNPMAWFIVLMFLAAIFAFSPTKKKNKSPPIPDSRAVAPASSPVATERVTIDVDPAYLMSLCRGVNSLRAETLMTPYVGKWIQFTGHTGNMSVYGGSYLCLVINLPDDRDKNRQSVIAGFHHSWRQRLEILQEDKPVTVLGQIVSVVDKSLVLENCELV